MASEMVKAQNIDQAGALEVRTQVNQIQYLMKNVLQEGEHYGTIQGCGNKPTLLQPGAEKIAYMFHFVPTYEVTRHELGNGHREYETKCTLISRDTGERVGEGLGTCSTMESKYRYRKVYKGNSKTRQENPDIADTWNTVLKISKKRSFVDAVKSTTAASDIFTQDIEDMVGTYEAPQPRPQVIQQRPQPPQPDPRKPLWQEVADLKTRALELGANEAGITSWIQATIKNQDGTPKPTNAFTVEEIVVLRDHLKQNIADLESLQTQEIIAEAEYVEPDYSNEDIPF